MNEKFPEELSRPANDNDTEVEQEKARIFAFNRIADFRKTIEASDMLVAQRALFLKRIDKIQDAVFNKESAPEEALSRVEILAKEYGFDFSAS
jgi:hypothetical protein